MKERWLYCIKEANLNLDKGVYALFMFAEAMGIVEKLTGVKPVNQVRSLFQGVERS